ncbi:putative leucine-rich repeat-containing protein DDB_G0290503 isoform X2 [Maniola hyperantus]|uniref:putative leucine-rich repeat-containing protein DDB_G0290503 isoform X2 n=1 Tax=Aphantopus hyperantus TaxID=2795564 RepID=UPI003748DBE8
MSTKKSPRAMPVETIITRNKSRKQQFVPQSRKQQFVPQSRKPISPKSKPVMKAMKPDPRRPKAIKSKVVQKSSVKTNEVKTREFYPNRPKRNIEYERIVLKPKHCMKMIGGTKSCNKRKLHMPRKEIKRIRHNSSSPTPSDNEPKSPKPKNQHTELSIKDMVLLIEEEGGLNDEDLLEILTCPSPVWWEDPPDGYIEEPIFARPKPAEQKSIKNQLLEEQNKEAERRKLRDEESTLKDNNIENLDVSKLGITVENRSVNFMNKRGKLESLLSSIRNKVKADNGILKKEHKKIAVDLNANNDEKNDKNVNHDSNKNTESTESKQETIKEIVTEELALKDIEKCDKIANQNRNKNQRVELKPKNFESCHRHDKNKTNNKRRASFKPKEIKNRNKKAKRQIKALELKEIVNIHEDLDNSTNENQNVESTPESDRSCINHEDVTKSNREKASSGSSEEKLKEVINIDDNLNNTANKNQNVESTPKSDKNCDKSYINHEDVTKNNRDKKRSELLEEKLKEVINIDEYLDNSANKNQNVESTLKNDKNCDKSNLNHEDVPKGNRDKKNSQSLEENLQEIINVDEYLENIEKRISEFFKEKLTEVINSDKNRDNFGNKNLNVECTPKSDKSSINHKDVTKNNTEKSSSESLEEDLLDLEDHEILSLENIEIPIAPNNATNPGQKSKSIYQGKINETVSYKANATNTLSAKISDAITDNLLGFKLNSFNTEKEENCTKKKFACIKLKSEKVNKDTDIDATKRKILKINVNKGLEEIEHKFSCIRVKKIEVLTSLNRNCTSEVISSKILPNNDHYIKKSTGSEKGRLNDPTLVKIEGKPNFTSDNVLLSNRKSLVKTNKSNLVSNSAVADACNMRTEATNYGLKEFESPKSVNQLSEVNTPVQGGCIEIQDDDDDDDDDLNNHIRRTNNTAIQIKNVVENDTSTQVKTIENHAQDKNIRRYSIDSATSEKNMSEEYLDMSLLDEDERKMELESRNNEFIYESDDYQSQSGSQNSIKKIHINFKSDLDMTDSNMYDQINESCNNDIIKYIKDNQKDVDTIQDNEKFNEDFNMINNTFRSSSPIQDNAISNKLTQDKVDLDGEKETEYVTVYKVINSDSENECNLTKTNEVKSGTLTVNNEVLNVKNLNETKKSAANEENLVENNEIADSELITYEEEYLTEFDEEEIVGNGNVGNIIQIDEVNAALNVNNEVNLTHCNEINEVVIKNLHNQDNSIKTKVGNVTEKNNNKGDLTETNEVPDTVEDAFIDQDNLTNDDPSKITDKNPNKLISNHNNYYQKDIRKTNEIDNIISNNKPKRKNHENIDCKSCNFKSKSILISENEKIKYCLLCSSIYDTNNCKYCIKKLNKECAHKNIDSEYVCDKCRMKVDDKGAIIEHLKQNCNE